MKVKKQFFDIFQCTSFSGDHVLKCGDSGDGGRAVDDSLYEISTERREAWMAKHGTMQGKAKSKRGSRLALSAVRSKYVCIYETSFYRSCSKAMLRSTKVCRHYTFITT